VFPNRLNSSFDNLEKLFAARIDVPADRKFIGLPATKKPWTA
jgi:hypothetical protein